ncbi:hypothetical protein Ntsu_12550 [Nocardia sp. IFM 10818]
MSALAYFVVVALSCIVIVAATRWGISGGLSIMPPVPDERIPVTDAYPFHRVPVHNLHRLHGRHRA